MKLELTGMKSGMIPALDGKRVIRGEVFDVSDELGKSLLITGMYKKIKEVKNVSDKRTDSK